ncbi:TPA: hypothetical protein QEM39_001692 [Pseudomonas putida]|uniref:hypothetical protein n=1 Tax=Pseudomonas putida TaxID=303 RepID=UPI0023644F91|nr:hypothetical protein [Pseudomonas putida]MDD2151867.1 hypothetical protein [Pseudomonas putida]HDS1680177.1 hypothetical protein [Pseudomonas putida]
MTKPFDMTLFLSGVLAGSQATQRRHLRQARLMQAAIQQRWQLDNPWTWQLKHVRWFLTQHLKYHSNATRYYYRLTALLVWKRLGSGRESLVARSTSRR